MSSVPTSQVNGPAKHGVGSPASSRFGSAASLVPPSPTTWGAPSHGETPEPTPCEATSSVGGPIRAASGGDGAQEPHRNSSPQPFHDAPMPYPRPSNTGTANSTASPSLPMPDRGVDRERSMSSLLMTTRDLPAAIVTGIRYRYMPAISKWNQEEIVLRVLHPNRGVSQDPLHAIFSVQLLPERTASASLNNSTSPPSASRGHADPAVGASFEDAAHAANVDDFNEETERFLPALARMFRHNITDVSEEDYFGEAQCQAMAEEFAHVYHRMKLPDAKPGQKRPPLPLLTNRFLVRVPKINIPDEFVDARKGFFSYRTHDTQEVLFLVEPDVSTCDALGIRFPPINAADARVADLADDDLTGEEPYYPRGDPSWDKKRYVEVAEAFSHMTYHLSDRTMLVEGMERTCGYLVDPIVYSKDRKQFGMCNSGLRGLSKWVARHRCNDVCALLQLPAVKRTADGATSSAATAEAMNSAALSPLDTYAAYFTDFAQSLCSVVILPMHRGQQGRSRSPMAASPLLKRHTSPRRRPQELTGPASPKTKVTTPRRRDISPHTPSPKKPAGQRASDAATRATPHAVVSPTKSPPAGPHPARLPPRPSIASADGAGPAPTRPTATASAATARSPPPPRFLSPRVTRKGPPPNLGAATGRRTSTASAASSPTAVTAAVIAAHSSPAEQMREPVKASAPPASSNRNVKGGTAVANASDTTRKYVDADAVDGSSRRTHGEPSSPVRALANGDLRGRETSTLAQTSPRRVARPPGSATASPTSSLGAGGEAQTPKRRKTSAAAAAAPTAPPKRTVATSRERPLNTRSGVQSTSRGLVGSSPPPRPRQTRQPTQANSTPDVALRGVPAPPPAKLPASARGVTKNVSFVRTPTTRALPFERQPSGPPLVKQRPFSRQATTGSLPSTSELVTPISHTVTPIGNVSPRGPPKSAAGLSGSLPPPAPLAPRPTNAASSPPKTSARQEQPMSPHQQRTPPPVPPKAPETFRRYATDVPVRGVTTASPVLTYRHSPPSARPPAAVAGDLLTFATTSTPPLLPVSPSRGKQALMSSPSALPQEPSKPSRTPEVDPLAQTTGGIDLQRQYIFPATKYVYNVEKLEWRRHRTLIRICNPETGVAQGAMRVCFEVNEVSLRGNGNETSHVAKMFRRTVSNVVEQDYFTEVEMQCLCAEFARNYNQEPVVEENAAANPRVKMHYVTAVVVSFDQKDIPEDLWSQRKGFFSYHTSDTDRCLFSMEPMLVGHFTKYNSNFGEAYRSNEKPLSEEAAAARLRVFEAAEALSHYSLYKSEGGLLLCDVQGVGSDLTDPEMHTYDGEGLSIGNMGKRGIDRFAQRHRCNDACRAIGLKSLCLRAPKPSPEALENNPYIKIMHKMRTTFTKCA